MGKRLAGLEPQLAYLAAIRAELPEDGIFVDEVTQVGYVSRLAFPVYRSAHVYLARLPGQSRLRLCHGAWRARHARPTCGAVGDRRRRLPVHGERNGDRYASPHSARHVLFNDGAYGNVRRIQAGALRQPPHRLRLPIPIL